MRIVNTTRMVGTSLVVVALLVFVLVLRCVSMFGGLNPSSSVQGASNSVTAVLCCSDCSPNPEVLFNHQPHGAIITVRQAGCHVSNGALAALESAVRKDHVARIVILVNKECRFLKKIDAWDPADIPLRLRDIYERLQNAKRQAQETSARQGGPPMSLGEAFARQQAEILLAESRLLRRAVAAKTLDIKVAIISKASDKVAWADVGVSP